MSMYRLLGMLVNDGDSNTTTIVTVIIKAVFCLIIFGVWVASLILGLS